MRVDFDTERGFVVVRLSRRNLLTLLGNLEGYPWFSDCTLYRRQDETSPILMVRAEPDDEHYAGRVPGPGTMSSSVETWMRQFDTIARLVAASVTDDGEPVRRS